MSWSERLVEAAYTSPTGIRMRFMYEDVSSSTDLRTTTFLYLMVNGGYVQGNGIGPRILPIIAYFTGPDCDQLGKAFENLCFEPGVGKLEHPIHGTFDVTPMGQVVRRDDLKSAANQTIIEVTFSQTLTEVFPIITPNLFDVSLYALQQFSEIKAPNAFAKAMDLKKSIQRARTQNQFTTLLSTVKAALRTAAEAEDSVFREFRALDREMNATISLLVGEPLRLARNLIVLAQLPGRSTALMLSRLEGYGNLLVRLFTVNPFGQGSDPATPDDEVRDKNNFFSTDLTAAAAVSGLAVSALNNKFTTRPEALETAQALLDGLAAFVEWRDQRAIDLGVVDTGEMYQGIFDAIQNAAAYLVNVSFSLLPERVVVLDRARTPLDLCSELYGSVSDERLNMLINSNNLSGSEILELQPGRRVRYYV